MRIILLIFLFVQLNNIHNLAYIGQDFEFHVLGTEQLRANPGQWIQMAVTNRPLVYWIGGACHNLTHGKYTYESASLLFVLLTLPALWLFYDSTRGVIASPLMRTAGLAFVAFLPLTFITAVVYAADTLALLPFALTCWSLIRCVQAKSARSAAGYMFLAGFTLSAGNLVKFTFIVVPVALLVCITVLRRWGYLSPPRWGWLVALAAAVPALLGGRLFVQSRSELAKEPDRHAFDWQGTGEMTWPSVLGLKWSDTRILNAPGYWDTEVVNGQAILPLLKNNSYSYPALLHLAVFTDVMDFAHAEQLTMERGDPSPKVDSPSGPCGVGCFSPFPFSSPRWPFAFVPGWRFSAWRRHPRPPFGFGCPSPWRGISRWWSCFRTSTMPMEGDIGSRDSCCRHCGDLSSFSLPRLTGSSTSSPSRSSW